MGRDTPRFLLTGPPGSGKTTLVMRVMKRLRAAGVPIGGFVTTEIREHGRRVGFAAEDTNGQSAVIAHKAWPAGPRVGRYRVDVAAIERIALPSIDQAVSERSVVVIDELGPMELHSEAFVQAVQQVFSQDVAVIATVHARAHPVTDALKQAPGVELVTVTREGQDELPERLATRLL